MLPWAPSIAQRGRSIRQLYSERCQGDGVTRWELCTASHSLSTSEARRGKSTQTPLS
jgi:hypothetical protein